MQTAKRKMGLDVGGKRVGVAISDALLKTAQGLGVINRSSLSQEMTNFAKMVEEYNVGEIVVGMPLRLDGTLGKQAKETKRYIERLRSTLGIPVRSWDERLTSKLAEKSMLQSGLRRFKRKKFSDEVAAILILQSYLDSLRVEAGREELE